MLIKIIRFIFINFCSLFIYKKFREVSPKKNSGLFVELFYSLISSTISAYSNLLVEGIDIYCFFAMFITYQYIIYKHSLAKNISITLISIATSFVIDYVSMVISLPIIFIIGNAVNFNQTFNYISYTCVGMFSFIFTILLFKIKRVRICFSSISSKEYSYVTTILSIGILFIYTYFRFAHIHSMVFTIIVIVFVLLIGIALFITTENEYQRKYKEHISSLKMDSLKNELSSQTKKLTDLEASNNALEKIIHRDNKIIPAMEDAVKDVLIDYTNKKASTLLENLNTLFSNRKETLTSYERDYLLIASSESIMLNSIVNFMYKRAIDNQISFQYALFGSISNMFEHQIAEDDFCTLLADLIENAIIAVKVNKNKNIMITINAFQEKCNFVIYDSGELFSKNILKKLGKKRATTHKKDGGTGIGLMTTFEILKKYNASFSIDETINNPQYTKCVSITFDGKHTHTYNGEPI